MHQNNESARNMVGDPIGPIPRFIESLLVRCPLFSYTAYQPSENAI